MTVLEFTFIVLLSRVSAVSLATKVLVPVGMVTVPALEIVVMIGLVNVLLDRLSVVDLPTSVSVAFGSVRVLPVDDLIVEIIGAVNVLLSKVSCFVSPENRDQTPPVNLYVLPVSISKNRD